MAPLRSSSENWSLTGKLLAIFLIILGGKLWLISACSSPLPFFDQWLGEGKNLIIPWLENRLSWADLVAPHNQHRILLTRLLVLGLFSLNHQWDAQVEMIAAAAVHAACAVALGAIIIRRLGREWEMPILATLLLLFCLPFDWEDTLSGGFQSQFYFHILCSIGAIWGLALHRPWSVKWGAGVIAAVLGWFSIASGELTAVAIGGWMAIRLFLRTGKPRDHWTTLAVCVVLTLAGLSLSWGVEMSENTRAKTFADFVTVFAGLLSWPLQSPPGVLLMYLPLGWLLVKILRTRAPLAPDAAEHFLMPLGFWVAIQAAVLAYGRNRYAEPVEVSRYMVFLAPGVLANLGCAALLARDLARPRRTLLLMLGLVWVSLALLNLGRLTGKRVHWELNAVKANNGRELESVNTYLASGCNPAVLRGKTPRDLQCENLPALQDVLNHPGIQAALPAAAGAAIPLSPSYLLSFEKLTKTGATPGGVAETVWGTRPPPPGHLAVFKSGELSPSQPYLEFRVGGVIGEPGAAIALVGKESVLLPNTLPDPTTGWSRILVKTPRPPFQIVAIFESGAGKGFAFTNPREVGRLSAWAAFAMESDFKILFAGMALWLSISLAEAFQRQHPARVPKRTALAAREIEPPRVPAAQLALF